MEEAPERFFKMGRYGEAADPVQKFRSLGLFIRIGAFELLEKDPVARIFSIIIYGFFKKEFNTCRFSHVVVADGDINTGRSEPSGVLQQIVRFD